MAQKPSGALFGNHDMKNFINLAITVGLLTLAMMMLNVEAMFDILKRGSTSAFVLAISINMLIFFVLGLRWYILASPSLEFSFQHQLSRCIKANFLNSFTPANLGGDAYRIMVFKGERASTRCVLKLLLRERILGLYGFVTVFVITYGLIAMRRNGGTVSVDNPYLYGLAIAVGLFALPFVMRLFSRRMIVPAGAIIGERHISRLASWLAELPSLFSCKGALWPMCLTLVSISLWVLCFKIVADGFGLLVPTLYLAVVATAVELIRLVPITLQGIGLREGAFSYLLSFYGYDSELCYVVGIVAYMALSISIFLCGPVGQTLIWLETNKGKV